MGKDPGERYQRGAEMVLDIQTLLEERTPPNQATQGSGSAVLGQPALGQPGVAAEILSVARALPLEKAAVEKLRKAALVGVLVLMGLFMLALWVISLGPQGTRRAVG